LKSKLDLPAELPKEQIGEAIRYYRKKRGLTAEKLAEYVGVSQSMISQMERGQTAPSLDTLWKLSYFLEEPVFSFFESIEDKAVTVIRKGEHKRITMSRPEVWYEMLSPNRDKKWKFFKMIIDPGENKDQPLMLHKGEESGYVIDGELEVKIEEETYLLREGDSISFESTLPHSFHNPGDKPAVAIWMMIQP
jgi:transcriptional regulator with XRE-family HTH domain